MNKFFKTIVLASVSLLILISAISCGGTGIAQEEYDNLKAQLSDAEAKIASLEAQQVEPPAEPNDQPLKDEISSLEAQIEELESDYTKLVDQNDTLNLDKASLEAQYTALNTKYEELQETLAELTEPAQPEIITTEKIESEIFRLLNEARVAAGVPELVWGSTLYNAAKQNSRTMAEMGKVTTSGLIFYEETFWAIYYESVDTIAQAAMVNWRANEYRFERGALLTSNKYCAIGAYESGPVFYITFMAAASP